MSEETVRLHARHTDRSMTIGSELLDSRSVATSTLAALLDDPPAVELTSSCTHALELAMTVLGVAQGDEVVVPAFAFPSVANAAVLRGATVRFADIDPLTGNIDVESVMARTNGRTRAVVCVHYGGVACDLTALSRLESDEGWSLVEDAAHSLFASYQGKPLGRFGRLGCLSFHRTKNISSLDGGAVVVNDPELIEPVLVALDKGTNRVDFDEGRVTSYEWSGPGSAWRMPDHASGVLVTQLAEREHIQRRRADIWQTYAGELATWAEATGARLPTVPEGALHPAHLFWVALPTAADRERLIDWCRDRRIEVARHYGSLPDSAYGRRVADPRDRCPAAADLAERLVRLPLHHQLSNEHVDRVLSAVTTWTPRRDPRSAVYRSPTGRRSGDTQ
jgi:dTDP-4-amino-4,6-dideoxygalactose transaminase